MLELRAREKFFDLFGDPNVQLVVLPVVAADGMTLQGMQDAQTSGCVKTQEITVAALQEHIGSMAYPRLYRLAMSRFQESLAILTNTRIWARPEGYAISKEKKIAMTEAVASACRGLDAVQSELSAEGMAKPTALTGIQLFLLTCEATFENPGKEQSMSCVVSFSSTILN
ncbi:hypothetical protein TWF696_007658 [Orbilia brochopaga]|uniref:Uncharacterized protein n=1 Tax=Orbilia brochopaga TaxID=3140254 RepID=A0AAV9UN65_9PEZI